MNQFGARLDAVHEDQRAGLDAGVGKVPPTASGPWMARKTRSSGSTLAVEVRPRARADVLSSAIGVAGIGDDHEAVRRQAA